jgi:flagella basal body P-ring formation protein FlgA
LTRGTAVDEAELELVERNLSSLPYGYYTDPALAVGKLAKRTIAANTVLTPQMLEAPKWVKRGERVNLVAESGAMTVRMVGEALADGAEGDVVRVRADGSKRVVDGIVIRQGVIKVTL